MRTVLRNTDEAAHVWAAQTQEHGKAGNVFFDGPTIYSYGRHFPIAKIYRTEAGDRIALFNPNHHSRSTSTHQRAARGAWQGNGQVIQAAVNLWPGGQYADKATETLTQARIDEIRARQAELDAANAEAAAEAKRAAARRKREQAKQAKLEAEEQRRTFPDRLAAWQAGEIDTHRIPEFREYGHPVQLRYIDGGRRIETSRRAVVPTRAALALWNRYTAAEDIAGQSCGPYTVNTATTETVVIGCHRLQVDTLREFFSRPAPTPTIEPEA